MSAITKLVSLNGRVLAIIIAGFLTVSIAYSIRYGYGMLLPEMLPSLGISKTQAGIIYAAYFIIYTTCSPLLGVLSDYYSYRTIVTIFTAILGAGALLMSYADGFLQAGLFFSIAAFGHAACWAPVVVLVQKWVPDSKRGTALSFVSIGVGTGIFTWGLVLPLIVGSSGWRSGWIALGVTGLIIALLNLLLMRNPAKPKVDSNVSLKGPKEFLKTYRDIFRQKTFWAIGIAYLFVGFNVIILFTFLPVYSREILKVPYAHSTRFISVVAFFGVCGQLTLGPFSDKVGRIRIMLACSALLSVACLGMMLFDKIWILYGLTAIYGIGYGAVWPLYAAAASDMFSRANIGGIIGLWTLLLGIGSIIAPVICGRIIDTTGSYSGVFLAAMSAGILSFLLLFIVPGILPARRKA